MLKTKSRYCPCCGQTKEESKFYSSQRKTLLVCKDCAVKDVADPYDLKYYLWIMRDLDIAYHPDVWNGIIKYGYINDWSPKMIMSKYNGKMKLIALRDLDWAFTEYTLAIADEKLGKNV